MGGIGVFHERAPWTITPRTLRSLGKATTIERNRREISNFVFESSTPALHHTTTDCCYDFHRGWWSERRGVKFFDNEVIIQLLHGSVFRHSSGKTVVNSPRSPK